MSEKVGLRGRRSSSSEVEETASSGTAEKVGERTEPFWDGWRSNEGPISVTLPLASPPLKLLLAFCRIPPDLATLPSPSMSGGAPKWEACIGGGVTGETGLPSDEEE